MIYVSDFIDEIIKILSDDKEITLKKSLIYNYNVMMYLLNLISSMNSIVDKAKSQVLTHTLIYAFLIHLDHISI